MESGEFSEELLKEVIALQESIREFCPEIETSDSLSQIIAKESDEMNELIEHRIKLLSESAAIKHT